MAIFNGGEGNDTLYGRYGRTNILTGGGGNDLLVGADLTDWLLGGDGNDTIFGLDGDDLILGGKGNDELSGNVGNDIIKGEGGDDIINIWGGADDHDVVDGGDGSDTISVAPTFSFGSSTKGWTIDLNTGTASHNIGPGANGGSATFMNIEHIIGSNGPDRLIGNAEDNRLTGGMGADTI